MNSVHNTLFASGCPSGWVFFDKTCYQAFYWNETYQNALDACKVYGGEATLAMPVHDRLARFLTTLR